MKESKRKRRDQHRIDAGAAERAKRKDYLPMVRRLEWLCAGGLTSLIVLLHLYRMTQAGPLWRDEVNTLATVKMPSLPEMWASLMYSRPPLLPYIVIRAWSDVVHFASTDISWRVLGALTGIGIVAALWLSGWLLRFQIPLLSLALFALNPNVIQWGDSPRGYGLGALMILVFYGLIWKVVESPTPLWISTATLFAVASVHSVFHDAPLVFAICAAGFLVCWRQGLRRRGLLILGIGAAAALTILPYLHLIESYQSINVVVALPSASLSGIAGRVAAGLTSGADSHPWAWFVGMAAAILAAMNLVFRSRNRDSEGRGDLALFASVVLLVGTGAYLLFLKEAQLTTFAWHCIPLYAAAALSIDALIELETTTIARKTARLAMTLAVAGVLIPAAWKQAPTRMSNVDQIAATLQQKAAPGDLVVVNPWYIGYTFQNYYHGKAPWMTVPPMEPVLTSGLLRLDLVRQEMMTEEPLRPVYEAMQRTLQAGNTIWWVGDLSGPPPGQLPPTLPPAPNGPRGWLLEPYQETWAVQLGHFITSHIMDAQRVTVETNQPVSPYEKTMVQYFRGWHP
jgi:hypothetical protein